MTFAHLLSGLCARAQAPAISKASLTLFFSILFGSLMCLGAGEKPIGEETLFSPPLYDESNKSSFKIKELLQAQNSILFVKEDCEPCLQMLKTVKSCDFEKPMIVAAAGSGIFQAQVRKNLPTSVRLFKISLDDLKRSTPGTPFLIVPNKKTYFGTLSCPNFHQALTQGQLALKAEP